MCLSVGYLLVYATVRLPELVSVYTSNMYPLHHMLMSYKEGDTCHVRRRIHVRLPELVSVYTSASRKVDKQMPCGGTSEFNGI